MSIVRLLLIGMAFLPQVAVAQLLAGPGQGVDGDSLFVAGLSVRLFGIDAPEGKQTCERGGAVWACGEEAANQLQGLVAETRVECRGRGTDSYGRMLAVCWARGVEINKWMVERGWATAFRKYSDDYTADELRAKAAGRGLWASTFVRPEDYRVQERDARGLQAFITPRRRDRASVGTSFQGCSIKGNRNRKGQWIYHMPGMPYYEVTRPEEIFCTEAEAQAAGYRRAIVR